MATKSSTQLGAMWMLIAMFAVAAASRFEQEQRPMVDFRRDFKNLCEKVVQDVLTRMHHEGVCDPGMNPTRDGFAGYFDSLCKAPSTCETSHEFGINFSGEMQRKYCPRFAQQFENQTKSNPTLCAEFDVTNFCDEAYLYIDDADKTSVTAVAKDCETSRQFRKEEIQRTLAEPHKPKWMTWCKASTSTFFAAEVDCDSNKLETLSKMYETKCESLEFCHLTGSLGWSLTVPEASTLCPRWGSALQTVAESKLLQIDSFNTSLKTALMTSWCEAMSAKPSTSGVPLDEYCEVAWRVRAETRRLRNGNFTCQSTFEARRRALESAPPASRTSTRRWEVKSKKASRPVEAGRDAPLDEQGETVFLQQCEKQTSQLVSLMQAQNACDPAYNPTRSGFATTFLHTCKAPQFCRDMGAAGFTFTDSQSEWYCEKWADAFESQASSLEVCAAFDVPGFCRRALDIRQKQPAVLTAERGCEETEKRQDRMIQENLNSPLKENWMGWCKASTTKFFADKGCDGHGDALGVSTKYSDWCASEDFCEQAREFGWSMTAPQAHVVCPRWSALLRDAVDGDLSRCETVAKQPAEFCEQAWVARVEVLPTVLKNGNFTCDSTRAFQENRRKFKAVLAINSPERERVIAEESRRKLKVLLAMPEREESMVAEETAHSTSSQTAAGTGAATEVDRPAVLNYEGTLGQAGQDMFLKLCEDVTTSAVEQMQKDGACDPELNPPRSGFDMLWESTCKAPEICEGATSAGLTFTSAEADWYCPKWAKLFDSEAKASPALCDDFDSKAFCKLALRTRLDEPMTEPIGELGCAAAKAKRQAEIKRHADSEEKPRWMEWCKASTTSFKSRFESGTATERSEPCQFGEKSPESLAKAFEKECQSVEFCERAHTFGWSLTAPQASAACPRWSDVLRQQLGLFDCTLDETLYCEAAWQARAEMMPLVLLNGNLTCNSARVKESRAKATYQNVRAHVHETELATSRNYENTLNPSGQALFLKMCEDVTASAVREMQEDGACDPKLNPTRAGFGKLWESTCKAPEICEEAFAAGLTFTSAEADWYCPKWAGLFDDQAKASPALCDDFDSKAFCKLALRTRLDEPMTEPIGELGCAAAKEKRDAEIQTHLVDDNKPNWMPLCEALMTSFMQEQSPDFQEDCQGSVAMAFEKQCRSVQFCETASSYGWSFTVPQANGACPRWSQLLEQQIAEDPDRCHLYASDATDYCEAAWRVRAEFMPHMLLNGNHTCDSTRVAEARAQETSTPTKIAFFGAPVLVIVTGVLWLNRRMQVEKPGDFDFNAVA